MTAILCDKEGRHLEVREYSPKCFPHLLEMYHGFSPKARFQGMPPKEKDACENWIAGLVDTGENFLAWQEGVVVGHVVMLPDFTRKDAEYLIFVAQNFRGRGIGSALTHAAIERAKELGLERVWLTVETYNLRATALYRKFAFEVAEHDQSCSECLMIRCL
jgi:RimJ/RimL family protein N-acetyltransferase